MTDEERKAWDTLVLLMDDLAGEGSVETITVRKGDIAAILAADAEIKRLVEGSRQSEKLDGSLKNHVARLERVAKAASEVVESSYRHLSDGTRAEYPVSRTNLRILESALQKMKADK
jgi:hypothetical protein